MLYTPSIPAGTIVLVDGVTYRLMTATLVEQVDLTNVDRISHG